jgi:hypothetical protein
MSPGSRRRRATAIGNDPEPTLRRSFGYVPRVSAIGGSCQPFFSDSVGTSAGELKVYRCDWGWYVRNGTRSARSRFLDAAFERVLGGPLDHPTLRALVEMLERELTAERDKTGRTASRELSGPRS